LINRNVSEAPLYAGGGHQGISDVRAQANENRGLIRLVSTSLGTRPTATAARRGSVARQGWTLLRAPNRGPSHSSLPSGLRKSRGRIGAPLVRSLPVEWLVPFSRAAPP